MQEKLEKILKDFLSLASKIIGHYTNELKLGVCKKL